MLRLIAQKFNVLAVTVTQKRSGCSKVMYNSKTVEIRSPNYGNGDYGNGVSNYFFIHLSLSRDNCKMM